MLPDGSTAVLNTDTAIAVNFERGERHLILLKGEAWFSVRHDSAHPFRVDAGSSVAEAVGTAFSVSREHRTTTVRVTEGVVALGARGQGKPQPLRLTAGTQASFPNPLPDPTPFDEHVDLAWRDQRLVIENKPLESALDELNRFRPGRILLMNRALAASNVSGTFTLDRLDYGLEALASSQGLHVTYLTHYLAIVH
jgi:transmembrane sensor